MDARAYTEKGPGEREGGARQGNVGVLLGSQAWLALNLAAFPCNPILYPFDMPDSSQFFCFFVGKRDALDAVQVQRRTGEKGWKRQKKNPDDREGGGRQGNVGVLCLVRFAWLALSRLPLLAVVLFADEAVFVTHKFAFFREKSQSGLKAQFSNLGKVV